MLANPEWEKGKPRCPPLPPSRAPHTSAVCGVAPCVAECHQAGRARRQRRPGGQAAGAPRPRRARGKKGEVTQKAACRGSNMAPQYHAPIVAQPTTPEPCRCCCSCRPSSPSFAPRVPACTPGTLERTLHSCCSCCTPTVSESDIAYGAGAQSESCTRSFATGGGVCGWGAGGSVFSYSVVFFVFSVSGEKNLKRRKKAVE